MWYLYYTPRYLSCKSGKFNISRFPRYFYLRDSEQAVGESGYSSRDFSIAGCSGENRFLALILTDHWLPPLKLMF